MNFKESCNSVVGYFRLNRKCLKFHGSLLFLVFVLLAGIGTQHQAVARPNKDVDLPPHDFNSDDEFRNVDNLEIHHIKLVDGVPQEDHPIIIYKEDFVSEDYVPPKNETKKEKHKRRYKDIGLRHRHRTNITDVPIKEEPEKILFDILPETPLIVPEDLEKPKKSHMKLVPLLPQETTENEKPNKEELSKRPKKFHSRVRRDTTNSGSHIVRKRNPYFRHIPKISQEVPTQIQYVYVKHSVPGKKHNGLDLPVPAPTRKPSTNGIVPISFDNRVAADDNDRVIFASGSRPATSRPTSTTVESIFRDPRPENFDFSFMSPQRPATTTTRTPIFTRRPVTDRPQEESIFRDPRPEKFDFSFMNQGQQASSQQVAVARAPNSSPSPQAGISQCVWAIVNCCSNRSNEIRYSCFEQNGCYGAFWGLNPCADNVRDSFVNYVADYYN